MAGDGWDASEFGLGQPAVTLPQTPAGTGVAVGGGDYVLGQGVGAPAAVEAPQALPSGGGVLPDGSTTNDPKTWARWIADWANSPTSSTGAQNAQVEVGQSKPPSASVANVNGWNTAEFGLGAPVAATAPTSATGEPIAASQKTGYLANIGAGVNEAISGLLGLPVDVTTGILNMVGQNINAVAGSSLPKIDNQVGGSQSINRLMGLVGANPENVKSATAGENTARSFARGVASMVLPGAAEGLPVRLGLQALGVAPQMAEGVAATLAQGAGGVGAVSGGVGAVTGDAARQLVPSEYGPLMDITGNLIGGGLAGVGLTALETGLRVAGHAGRNVIQGMPLGKTEPIIDPRTNAPLMNPETGQPYMARKGAQQLAGQDLVEASGMTPQDLADAIPNKTTDVNITGSTPSLGSQIGNVGLLNEQRQLKTKNPIPFQIAEARNELSQAQAVKGIRDPNASGVAAGEFVAAQLAQLRDYENKLLEAEVNRAQQTKEGLTKEPYSELDEKKLGEARRLALEELRKPIKAAASRMYDAIDPDGTAALDVSSVGDTAKKLIADIDESAGDEIEPRVKRLLDAASNFNGVQLFSRLRKLDSNLSEVQRKINVDPNYGRESPPARQLVMLRQAVDATMTDGAASAAERSEQSVAGGATGPTVGDRLLAFGGNGDAAAAGNIGVENGGPRSDGEQHFDGNAGTSATGVSQESGGQSQSNGGSGNAGADRSVAAGSTVAGDKTLGRKRAAPDDLMSFIIRKGGIKDDKGDVFSMGGGAYHHRAGGRLINKTRGVGDDYMREAAVEAGFLPPDADLNDFYNAIGDGLSGRKVYRPSDIAEAEQTKRDASEQGRFDAARATAKADVLMAEDDGGYRLTPNELQHAIELAHMGEHAEEAIRQAILESEHKALDTDAKRRAFGTNGVHPNALQGEMPTIGGRRLAPNFGPNDRGALRAANQNYAAYKDNWRNGAVGTVLQSGQNEGFNLAAASVGKTLFRRGGAGAAPADQLIKNAGSPEAAVQLLGDYPAFAFLRDVQKDGAIDPAKAAKWIDDHKAVLDRLPELREKFADAATAQKTVEDVAANGQAAIKLYQKSAARHYLLPDGTPMDGDKAIAKLIESPTAESDVKSLVRQMSGNRAALDGLRANLSDYIINKAKSVTEAGVTGEQKLKDNVFKTMMENPRMQTAIDAILPAEQRGILKNIANDIEMSQRLVNATNIKGSPGSAADIFAQLSRQAGKVGVFGQIAMASALGAGLETSIASGSSMFGLWAGILSGIANHLRLAGIRTIDELKTQAILDPQLGKVLAMKVPLEDHPQVLQTLLSRIASIGAGSAATRRGKDKR
jgi:hypothetical protein